MKTIEVRNLRKIFRRPLKSEGFKGLLKFYFNPSYDEVEALKGISFDAYKGEILTILGPNGAGKTTTLKILTGILHPTDGTARVLGHIPQQKEREFLNRIGFLSSQRRFAQYVGWDLPAVDVFRLVKAIYDIENEAFRVRVKKFVDMLEIGEFLEVPIRKLSLGQRAKVEIITAVLHYPDVLFLDEPTLGLDVVAADILRNFIIEYVRETGSTVIFTSHYMKDVESLSDRLIIIDRGEIIFEGDIGEIYRKFSKFRKIKFILEGNIEKPPFEEFLQSHDGNELSYTVAIDETKEFISAMISKYPVRDLTVEEQDLEDIIKTVFRRET